MNTIYNNLFKDEWLSYLVELDNLNEIPVRSDYSLLIISKENKVSSFHGERSIPILNRENKHILIDNNNNFLMQIRKLEFRCT
mgnify:CR=1 FL=1